MLWISTAVVHALFQKVWQNEVHAGMQMPPLFSSLLAARDMQPAVDELRLNTF
jgi:hypothetical protein